MGGGSLTMKYCQITNNSAANGGGIRHEYGSLYLYNLTVAGNSASIQGNFIDSEHNGLLIIIKNSKKQCSVLI